MPIHALCLLLLFSCLFTTPAFAQKTEITKVITKLTEKSTQKNVQKVFSSKMPLAWRKQALKDANAVDQAFKTLFAKTNKIKTYQLLDIASFRMYNENHGLVPAISDFWAELLENLQIIQNGPVKIVEESTFPNKRTLISPIEMRKQLLQKEARLKHALREWKKVKILVQKNLSPAQKSMLSTQYTISQFLFEDYTGREPLCRDLSRYISGEFNIIQTITYGKVEHNIIEILENSQKQQINFENLYNKILAWAHGQEKFPYSFWAAYQMLKLYDLTSLEQKALYENLDSPACDTLRDWGWTDSDIRELIKTSIVNTPNNNLLWDNQQKQLEALDKWQLFWRPVIEQEAKNTRQVLQLLEDNP